MDQPPAPSSSPSASPAMVALVLRALNGTTGLAQVWFQQAVLDRYRAQDGARVIRTNSAGRVRAAAGWSLDFGIHDEAGLIHASIADLAQRLPAGERAHWARHTAALPSSGVFLTMRLSSGGCIDDGDVRDWSATDTQLGG